MLVDCDPRIHGVARMSVNHTPGAWEEAFEEHRHHREFRTESWALDMSLGFTCGCQERECLRSLSLRDFRHLRPELRLAWQQMQTRERRLEQLDGRGRNARRESREWVQAVARAKRLLGENLSREQRRDFKRTKTFTVAGSDGRTYRIEEGSSHNVVWTRDGVDQVRYCVVVSTVVPQADQFLAQKLVLEADAPYFRSIANATVLPGASEDVRAEVEAERERKFQQLRRDEAEAGYPGRPVRRAVAGVDVEVRLRDGVPVLEPRAA